MGDIRWVMITKQETMFWGCIRMIWKVLEVIEESRVRAREIQ